MNMIEVGKPLVRIPYGTPMRVKITDEQFKMMRTSAMDATTPLVLLDTTLPTGSTPKTPMLPSQKVSILGAGLPTMRPRSKPEE